MSTDCFDAGAAGADKPRSLSFVDEIGTVDTVVTDDARTECDAAERGSTYPPSTRMVRQTVNRGVASKTARALAEDVLARVPFTNECDTGMCG